MHPIGIFDSGYGGLTVFKSIRQQLPQYDYIYLGDNARAPYGDRSFETVYEYTLQAVKYLFNAGCPLIILACNTASAKVLRQIQEKDLPQLGADKRILGVIRPSAEEIGKYTKTNHIGIVGTRGTINSQSYVLEIEKSYPDITVHQQACPMWVPIIENNEQDTPQADIQVEQDIQKLLAQSTEIDTILLGCTHYPLLIDSIKKHVPDDINIVIQGDIVADKLVNYLSRHPQMEARISKNKQIQFFTTDNATVFNEQATHFFGETVHSQQINLPK